MMTELCDFVERRSRIHQTVQAARRRRYDRRLTVSQRPDHQWQCNLAYFHYGKTFILTKVDTFSRLADAEVVPNKSGPAVLRGFCKIFERRGTPRLLQTDEGKEFFNALFRRFCDENGIEHFNTNTKALMVEWFNHTLGTLLKRHVRSDKGISLKGALRTEIEHYNQRPGSVFGFRWSPRQVHDDAPDSALVWRNDRRVKRLLRRRLVETPKHCFKLAVGDHVRLLERQSIFDKAYSGNYSQEVFHVEERKWAPWRNWVAL